MVLTRSKCGPPTVEMWWAFLLGHVSVWGIHLPPGTTVQLVEGQLIAAPFLSDRAKVTVTLDVHAHLLDGAPDHVVRTVTENAHTLKFKDFGFEEM